MMRFTAPLAVAACLLIAADDPPPAAQKDPQAAVEPRSAPGSGHKFLERLVGDWDVVKAFHPRSGEPVRSEGRCRQTMIHGGRFLQSEFTFRQGGSTTTGLGLIGFEPESGTFTSAWTDSRQTRMSFRQSQDPFDGQAIVLYSRSLGPDTKDARRSRTVTRLEDGDRKLVHRQYNPGPDGSERLLMEMVMTRKTSDPRPAR